MEYLSAPFCSQYARLEDISMMSPTELGSYYASKKKKEY